MLEHLTIPEPDEALSAEVSGEIDRKTKPPGSLGRIEALACQIAVAQNTRNPTADPAHLLLFAGDHGIVEEGVSAWPQEVTGQMVLNFLSGGAAANAFAEACCARISVVDAGLAVPLGPHEGLIRADVRAGTRNAALEDALTESEVRAAMEFGAGLAIDTAEKEGARVIALGEMGIGNTSSAALLAHAIAGIGLEELTGPGAGLPEGGLDHKTLVLKKAAARHALPLEPVAALCAYGGLEIACMAGALIGAASRRCVVVVDGFISTAAALTALRARPGAEPYVVFSHRSQEPGHRLMLAALSAQPLLDLDLRLGEGSGALLALPLIRSACAMLNMMATFDGAGVSGQAG